MSTNTSAQTAVVDRIHQYAEEAETFAQQKSDGTNELDEAEYEERLDDTLNRLQQQVDEQRLALEKLRVSMESQPKLEPAAQPQQRLAQVKLIRAAYEKLVEKEPIMPGPGSSLPALITLKQIHAVIGQTKSGVQKLKEDLIGQRKRLEQEESNLKDATLVTEAMENRIGRLRREEAAEGKKSPSQRAKEMINEQRQRKQVFSKESEKLRAALNSLIEDPLATMIAAEDLGGPVAGDLLEIEDGMLELGFNSQGKVKKSKASTTTKTRNGRRRVDEYLGGGDVAEARREAAVADFKSLVEKLLSAYYEGNIYIDLNQDSAAARFLVRAKVAQFHPRDAERLRLVDFGREMG